MATIATPKKAAPAENGPERGVQLLEGGEG